MSQECSCTRFFTDCDEAARIYDRALKAYEAGRDEWGKTLTTYYLWHKRRSDERTTIKDA